MTISPNDYLEYINVFGPTTKKDIRVGYISTDRGLIEGISINDANKHAKLDPGTTFIFRTREKINYLNINEVNKLNTDDLIPDGTEECAEEGVEMKAACGPVRVHFSGGGGVGVQGNPVVGKDGSVLAVDLVHHGFGYKYAPQVKVNDNCNLGAGAIARAFVGETAETTIVYSDREQFEDYVIEEDNPVGFGSRYAPDGKVIGVWNPKEYTDEEATPFKKVVDEYVKDVQLWNDPWWTTRMFPPLAVTSDNQTTREKYDVQHWRWGGHKYHELVEVQFDIYWASPHQKKGLGFEFTSVDGKHQFVVRDTQNRSTLDGSRTEIIRIHKNMPYNVVAIGERAHKAGAKIGMDALGGHDNTNVTELAEIGILKKLGRGRFQNNANADLEGGVGISDMIYADFLDTLDDNDDLQIVANLGKFSATDPRTVSSLRGSRTTYDVTYIYHTGETAIVPGFMNNNAISPKPMSNARPSDFAGHWYTFEWEENFPWDGDYIFRGAADNEGKLYIDNALVSEYHHNYEGPPVKEKKTIKEGRHTIRLDLYNTPVMQKVKVQTDEQLTREVDFHIGSGSMFSNGVVIEELDIAFSKPFTKPFNEFGIHVGQEGQLDENVTRVVEYGRHYKVIFSSKETQHGIRLRVRDNGKVIEMEEHSDMDWTDIVVSASVGEFFNIDGNIAYFRVNTPPLSTGESSTEGQIVRNVFNTVDWINRSNRRLWRTNVFSRGGFINEYGICPYDTTANLEDNPYAGTHKIVWNSVQFPLDGTYDIEIQVDDNVTLTFDGPTTEAIFVDGFLHWDAGTDAYGNPVEAGYRSNGKKVFRRFFKQGSYTLTADLEQIPGGVFGFDQESAFAIGKGINPMALAVRVQTTFTEEEIEAVKSWNENPMGIAMTIEAPLPPIPEAPIPIAEGRCPNNPLWTTRFPNSAEKWHPVAFHGQEMHPMGIKSMKGFDDTIGHIILQDEDEFATQMSEDAFRESRRGFGKGNDYPRAKAMGFTDSDIRYYLENDYNSLIGLNMQKLLNDPEWGPLPNPNPEPLVGRTEAWSPFFNLYAISPIPPFDEHTTSGAGINFTNSWPVDFPYPGWYKIRCKRDNWCRIYVGEKLIFDGGKEGAATWRLGHGEVKFEMFHINHAGVQKLRIELENDSFEQTKVIDEKIFSTLDWIGGAAVKSKEENVNFHITSGSMFANAIEIPELDIRASKPYTPVKIQGKQGGLDLQIDERHDRNVQVNKVYEVIFTSNDPRGGGSPNQSIKYHGLNSDNTYIRVVRSGKRIELKDGDGKDTNFSLDIDEGDGKFSDDGKKLIFTGDRPVKIRSTWDDDPDKYGVAVDSVQIGNKRFKRDGESGSEEKTIYPNNEPGGDNNQPYVRLRNQGENIVQMEDHTDFDWTDIICRASVGRFFDFQEGNGRATCKYVVGGTTSAAGGVSSGEIRDGVTYLGPHLFHYTDSRWGRIMNNESVSPIASKTQSLSDPNDNIIGTKIMTWRELNFPITGNYQITFLTDNPGTLFIDGKAVLGSKSYKENEYTNDQVQINAGRHEIRLEVENLPPGGNIFLNNPTGVVCRIYCKRTVGTGIFRSWAQNPIGISAEIIPPPCPRLVKGTGIITHVEIEDPGNGYPKPGPGDYPVTLKLSSVTIENPGINYRCGEDKLVIVPSNGAELDYECGPFGKITKVIVKNPGLGFDSYPEITMPSETGVNLQLRPQFEVVRDPILPPDKLIQVTDLVGLKQTGYYRGRAYYGAVFYKEGVRYAGYYETAGQLVQIYDTMQESIDAMVTTPPSAILRQGTDITSNDPRLDIPETPENLT